MPKCAKCDGSGCDHCGNSGYTTDCTLKEHWAEVGGKRYILTLDRGSGTHRFPKNPIVRDMMDAARVGRKFDLNDVAEKHGMGDYTTKELLEFYMLIGYTIGGLAELSFFQGYKMSTCEWSHLEKKAAETAKETK